MKNKALLIFGGAACLLFALFSGCGGRSGEKEYSKAVALMEDGDLVRAQGQFEKAVRKLSDGEKKAEADNRLGIVLWKLGKPDQAIEKFSESCRLSEEITGANENLAAALYHAGRLDESEFEFTKILNEHPDNAAARTFMGLVQMKKHNWAKASGEITKGLRASPNHPAGQNALALAELHQNQGSDPAIKRLKQLVAAYPGYVPAAYNLAAIYDQWLHNPSAALGWYRQYLKKSGGQGQYADRAKQAIARLERKAPASAQATRPEPSSKKTAAQLIAEGTKLHAAKKYKEAVAQYRQAIAIDPAAKTAHYNLGLSYYALEDYSKAAQACTAALKIDPRFSNARYMLALAYSQQKNWSAAEREAKTLQQTDPDRGKSLLDYISKARK